jgi:hypothetical protein
MVRLQELIEYLRKSLKVEPNASADRLYPVLLDIWNEERFPSDWKEGIIDKIPKQGDLSNCSNWWGITPPCNCQ